MDGTGCDDSKQIGPEWLARREESDDESDGDEPRLLPKGLAD